MNSKKRIEPVIKVDDPNVKVTVMKVEVNSGDQSNENEDTISDELHDINSSKSPNSKSFEMNSFKITDTDKKLGKSEIIKRN
jgi:hypothetical protein